ncbi:hypothetical protein [Gordonia humi]|uniref:Uncharacterized protein n=1 Tax=Gordonia humi TaxID=686429 RepID=A0A840F951_9ACTN|nr:hypothetical protein [Gordonia humi]MBB4136047.1 hypothetical protein [Gordonia humi]
MPRPRTPSPVTTAAVTGWTALIVALAVQALLVHRQDEWNAQVRADHCRHLPDLPAAAVYGVVSTVFAVAAAAAFGRWLWLISHGPPGRWWTAAMPIAGVLALLVLAMFILQAFSAPTEARYGTDGSGTPCGVV